MGVGKEKAALHQLVNIGRLVGRIVIDLLILPHATDPVIHIINGNEQHVWLFQRLPTRKNQ